MPKKAFKGAAGKPNALPKSNASSKLAKGRRKDKDPGSARSAETIARLKMYNNGKAIRNRAGRVVAGSFMMGDRAGDRQITAATGRIAPDRRWFGNTRTVAQTDLDKFREEMTQAVSDPYSVVLKRKKIPMGLLQDAAEYARSSKTSALLEQEPFAHAFGSQSRRKRVKLDQLLVGRTVESVASKKKKEKASEGAAEKLGPAAAGTNTNDNVDDDDDDDDDEKADDTAGYEALLSTAQTSQETYQKINTEEGIVPWGRDSNLANPDGEGLDWRHEKKDDLFLKGQSKRIWGEFFKVVDCSDVVLHIIDARNVPGTRCTMIERHIQENAKHKHLVFVLNKIDLVPNWVAKRWMGELAKDRPTIAFHASLTHAFGKGALISLLRQFGKLHEDKKQISVGVIGYPNVGKSSVINTLISKKSCKVAPIPGETKIWQYITLFKRISLIDCPGVVVDTAGDTETDSVLKGVVRAERLESPEDYIDAIVEKVKREHVAAQYKLPVKGDDTWSDSLSLMEMIARRCGRLRKGGDPCIRSAAIMLINDFQRGRLPHYVAPPELKTEDGSPTLSHNTINGISVTQNLDSIGEDKMKELSEKKMAPVETNERKISDESKVSKNSNDVGDDKDGKPQQNEDFKATKPAAASLIGSGEWDD